MIKPIQDTIRAMQELLRTPNTEQLYKLSTYFQLAFKDNVPVYFTGIGKPGYIAEKLAATCKSVMLNSNYLNALTAGHGDLGQIPTVGQAYLFMLSKSGCSGELWKLADILSKLRQNLTVIMVCLSDDAQYYFVSAHVPNVIRFYVPELGELEGYGIIPSTSNSIFEAVFATAIANAAETTIGIKGLCSRLQQAHPSGTLQNKVTELLSKFENDNTL